MSLPGLFITGTDTDVGKTYVAALMAQQLAADGVRVGAYKPVCSGSVPTPEGGQVWEDVERLCSAVGGSFPAERVCPQRFAAPLAPPVAARLENNAVDAQLLRAGIRWWQGRVDLLLVECVGGLLCPLTETESVADLAEDLGFPLVVVATTGLGTINHTLLTVEVAKHRGLTVAGVVLNHRVPPGDDMAAQTNLSEIAARCDVPVLGVVRHGSPVALLQDGRPIRIDWRSLCRSRFEMSG